MGKPITREELLVILRGLDGEDPEKDHGIADAALLDFIHDPEIRAAYEALERWYA